MPKRRVWSEEVPLEMLRSRPVTSLCRRYGLEVVVSVRPSGEGEGEEELPRTLEVLEDAGVPAAIWPMLGDAAGRWANAENATAFVAFVDRLARRMDGASVGLREIVLDLEPAIDGVRALLTAPLRVAGNLGSAAGRWLARSLDRDGIGRAPDGRSRRAEAARYAEGRRALGELCARMEARNVAMSAAALPLLLFDEDGADARGGGGWEAVLGTPMRGLALSHVSVMLYTSIIEGWSRGLCDRAAARELLGVAAQAAVRRFGGRAGVSLGAVGVGAFGDEPVYRSAEELAEDVGIARAAGVDDLALLDLGGVLARPHPEAWLEAFAHAPPAAEVPPLGARARLAWSGVRAATRVLRALQR